MEHRVRQLRVVVAVEDFDAAVRFFRDQLGMPELIAFAEGGDDRVAVLDAGRATFEIASAEHARAIDRAEAPDGAPGPDIRFAFEVDDAAGRTAELEQQGVSVLAPPVLTPWLSVNSRLSAPGDLVITLFEETEPLEKRLARPGFGTDSERDAPPDR